MRTETLVISAGMVHPNLMCRMNLKRVLKENPKIICRFSDRLDSLQELSDRRPSIVVLYFQKKVVSDQLLGLLEDFVFNGGGLLALHSASASFKRNDRYFNLIGGRFIRHGKIAQFKVDAAPEAYPLYKGIGGFSIADELYEHDYLKDVTVHFSTKVNNKREPVVWTRELGKGKVAYCSLGHRAAVFKQAQVKSIINISLDWLLSGHND